MSAQAKVIEERPLRLLRLALLELDECVAGLQPVVHDVEAELGELRERRFGICDAERDVVEVVGDPVLGDDERKRDPLGAVELDSAFLRSLDGEVRRELGQRLVEVEHPQADSCERAGRALGLGGEQRQLATAGIGPDERELVGAVDDMHAHPVDEELRQFVPVADPEGDVVQRLDLHTAQTTHDSGCNAGKSGEIPLDGRRGVNGERKRRYASAAPGGPPARSPRPARGGRVHGRDTETPAQ
jgi:hypothetical protein